MCVMKQLILTMQTLRLRCPEIGFKNALGATIRRQDVRRQNSGSALVLFTARNYLHFCVVSIITPTTDSSHVFVRGMAWANDNTVLGENGLLTDIYWGQVFEALLCAPTNNLICERICL